MRLQQKIRDDALTVGVGLAVGGVVRWTMTKLRETNLQGEVALITGARSPQSLALASALAAAGCRVVTDRAAIRMPDHALRAHGIDLFIIPAEVAEGVTTLPWVEGATTRYGRIDLLVTVAGAQHLPRQRADRQILDRHATGADRRTADAAAPAWADRDGD